MWKRIAVVVAVAGCPHRGPVPCASVQVFPKEPPTGTLRLVHADLDTTVTEPAPGLKLTNGGGGSPLQGLEGPTNFAFGAAAWAKLPPDANTPLMVSIIVRTGDYRTLGNGTHPAEKVEIEYRVCLRQDRCPHACKITAGSATFEITEAEGGPADFPDGVTPNFHRKLRVRARGEHAGTLKKSPGSGGKPTCKPLGYDLDMTVVVDKRDFSSQTGMCGGH